MRITLTHCSAIAIITTLLTAVGCSGYAIEGRVVRGSVATIQVVSKNDRRLTESNPTGGGALIQAVFEPETPSDTRSLGQFTTDGQGWFSIPVDAFGAGTLEYEAQLVARREGHQGVMAKIDLPGRGQRVLITLPLGKDTLVVPESFLNQTLREAKPYLDQNR